MTSSISDFLCGLPLAYWNAVSDSAQTLLLCGPLEPYSYALIAQAQKISDSTPYEEGLEITHQMVEAGKVMGIEVFDHIIIGEDAYVSLQQEGKLK